MSNIDTKRGVKNQRQFTAGNIDSLAPHERIVDELQNKNPQAFLYYCHILRQRRTYYGYPANFHFVTPGHPIKQFNDDWDGDVIEDYFEDFAYKSFNPKIISPLRNIDIEDPVTKLLKIKADQYATIRNMKSSAVSNNSMSKYEELNDEVVRCPQHLVDLAASLDSDLEPYFDSVYNWYYAGHGNMQLVCIHWVDYLLHSDLNKLYISEFNKDNICISPQPQTSFDCGEDCNIFETICSPQLIVTLRTRNKIFILRIVTKDDKLELEKIKEVDSLLPFTGISYDSYHQNILYVTTLDNNVNIVNLERMTGRTVKLKSKVTTLKNNWNKVIGAQRMHYTHITGKSITCYDKRTNNVAHSWKNLRDVTDEVLCNDITAAIHKEGSTLLYFGTDHHLFLIDMRCVSNSKLNAIQRWTHGMQSVPVYMSISNFEFNKDLICMSSQWCEDMCVVSNYNDIVHKDLQGVMIPYRPPSILNTLNAAKEKLLCCDLYNPIDSRICTAITGSLLIEHGEKYLVLMQNSLGDITSHQLVPKHLEMFLEDNAPEALDEWSKDYKVKQKPFEVSSIVNIGNVWKKLKKIPDTFSATTYSEERIKFSEKEIFDRFENEEIEVGLLDIWLKEYQDNKENTLQESSIFLHFSDSE